MPARAWLLAPALAVAFSPALRELGVLWIERPWTRYALCLALLGGMGLVRPARPRPPPDVAGALPWLAAGLVLELVALGAGLDRAARAALVPGLVGACRATGACDLRTAGLALWIVPIPAALATVASPALEQLWARLAVDLVGTLGAPLTGLGSGLQGPGGTLVLDGSDAGLATAAALSGAAWWLADRRSLARGATLWSLLAAVGAALPLQAVGVAVAGGLTGVGLVSPARALLTALPGLAAAGLALAGARRALRQPPEPVHGL